jgi:hypothetical protein
MVYVIWYVIIYNRNSADRWLLDCYYLSLLLFVNSSILSILLMLCIRLALLAASLRELGVDEGTIPIPGPGPPNSAPLLLLTRFSSLFFSLYALPRKLYAFRLLRESRASRLGDDVES